jgi:hypothetical protein
LWKDKLINNNLGIYYAGIIAISLMFQFYSTHFILNGVKKSYSLPYGSALTSEPQLQSGMSWFKTLPPTKIHECNRNKYVRSSSNGESETKRRKQ